MEGVVREKLAEPAYIYNAFLYNTSRNQLSFPELFKKNCDYFFLNLSDLDQNGSLSEDEYLVWQEIFCARKAIDNEQSSSRIKALLRQTKQPFLPQTTRQAYFNSSYFFASYLGQSEFFPLNEEPGLWDTLFDWGFKKFFNASALETLDRKIIASRQKVFASNFARDSISDLVELYQQRIELNQHFLAQSLPEKSFLIKNRILSDLVASHLLNPGNETSAYLFVNYLSRFYDIPDQHLNLLNNFLRSYRQVVATKKEAGCLLRYFSQKYPQAATSLTRNCKTTGFVETEKELRKLLSRGLLSLDDLPLALEKLYLARFSYSADPQFCRTTLLPEKFFQLNRGVCDEWSFSFYFLLNKLNYPCEYFVAKREMPSGHAFALFPWRGRYYIFQETGIGEKNFPSREEALKYFKKENLLGPIFRYSSSRPSGQTLSLPVYQSPRPLYFEKLALFDEQQSTFTEKILGLLK